MALLLPDPCDPNCTSEFKQRARNILVRVQGASGAQDIDLRRDLLRFIGEFTNWENSTKPTFVEAARGLVRAAHGADVPLVVDPFAGGGSIPLEALRLGCDTFASDLNPVACLILRTMLQDIPRHGPGLADELRTAGEDIKKAAESALSALYPADPDGTKPIAYLWARTITCDTCGTEIPLVRSFWLVKKGKRRFAIRYSISGHSPAKKIEFHIFEPKQESEVPTATVMLGKATCPVCHQTMGPDRLKLLITQQRGCSRVQFDSSAERLSGPLLLAVVLKNESGHKSYRAPRHSDYVAYDAAVKKLGVMLASAGSSSLVPTERFSDIRPSPNARGLTAVTRYGINEFSMLYLERQLLSIAVFGKLISSEQNSPVIQQLLALTLSRVVDYCSTQSRWDASQQRNVNSFGRQALPMLWDFAELVPFRDCVGSWDSMLNSVVNVVTRIENLGAVGSVQNADAAATGLPDDTASIWFTDPPYYDSVPYADLSDFFYVWLKRFLPKAFIGNLVDHASDGQLTPKSEECVWNAAHKVEGKPKDVAFFERKISRTFIESRRITQDDGIGCVVFAHKTTEGWESLLRGIVDGGWVVVGSWPIATEQAQRLVARDSAALATSVHLICRPRSQEASIGDWGNVLQELPHRVGSWIERLQAEGIKGADLVFACIGPAMEIYSRYSRVEDAQGKEIPLGGDPTSPEPHKRGFLAYVWETVGRLALEQVLGTAEARARNGGAGALEEDSRLTALFLWTLQATEAASNGTDTAADDNSDDEDSEEEKPKKKKAGFTLLFDVTRRFAQPLGIHLEKWEGRIIETEKGVVRLLPVTERAKHLFGDADAATIGHRIEQDVKASRNYTFAFMQDVAAPPEIKARGRGKRKATTSTGAAEVASPQTITTLDRVHAAMLLQASGQANGLRAMLKEEQQRGPDFLRLANALSALYPKDSEDKRLLDAMLLAVPRN